jgi:hypothetical protein
MNDQEFGSDTDDSDFCPENFKDDADSEMDEKADALDAIDDDDDDNKTSKKKQKRKKSHAKEQKTEVKIEVKQQQALDPDEEKRREDALWAEFLADTETTPSTSSSTITSSSKEQNIPKPKPVATPAPQPARKSPLKIFEFAGEEVIVNETKPSSSENASEMPKAAAVQGVKRSGGGLSSVLNQISKKNKLSILQKTKLDWDGFKTNEGISEELQTHNRGRDG